jgi:hypothetical protein
MRHLTGSSMGTPEHLNLYPNASSNSTAFFSAWNSLPNVLLRLYSDACCTKLLVRGYKILIFQFATYVLLDRFHDSRQRSNVSTSHFLETSACPQELLLSITVKIMPVEFTKCTFADFWMLGIKCNFPLRYKFKYPKTPTPDLSARLEALPNA